MAVAPPFDIIVNKPGSAINKLQSALNKSISKINEKVTDAISKTNKLPKNINCADPRIRDLKQDLLQLQTLLDQIQGVLTILNIIIPILKKIATTAAVALNAQLLTPVPAPPAVGQAIAVQNQLIANIIACLKQAGIIITIVNGSITLISALLAPVINMLSSICNTETLDDVFANFRNTTIDSGNVELVNIQSESEFYQLINVSADDIQSRQQLLSDLEQQQRSLLDLLEAPSKVITGQGYPANDIGKSGDYFIDRTNNIIYGPKLSDSEWPTAVNY